LILAYPFIQHEMYSSCVIWVSSYGFYEPDVLVLL